VAERLNGTLQENVITVLAYDDTHGKIVANLVNPDLFEGEYRIIAERCIDYWRQHQKAPKAHIADLVADVIEDPQNKKGQTYRRILISMLQLSESINVIYVVNTLSAFVQGQKLKSTIIRAYEVLEAKQELGLQEARELLDDVLRTREIGFNPGLSLLDYDRVLQFLQNRHSEFVTGIKQLDDRSFVPARQAVMLFLAPTGRGKCIAKGQKVLLPDGRLKLVEDVVRDKDPFVMSLNERTKKIEKGRVVGWWCNGRKRCCKVVTKSGREVVTTKNHLYLTQRGWLPVKELRTSDYVAVLRRCSGIGKKTFDSYKLRLLAYLIADGSLTRLTEITYMKHDRLMVDDFKNCVRKMGDNVSYAGNHTYYVVGGEDRYRRHGLCRTRVWLKSLGLLKKKSNQKFIPEFVFELNDSCVSEFLRALISSDGSIYRNGRGASIEYASSSIKLIDGMRHLLVRFGILPKIVYFTARYGGKEFPGYAKIVIRGTKNVLRYLNAIGFIGCKKDVAADFEEKLYKMPGVILSHPQGTKIYSDQVIFDKVKAIVPVGERETFDIAVEDHHNFVVEDMVAHNTWFLVHVGRHAIMQRKKVVHITLELTAEETLQRYYQNFFSVPKRQLKDLEVTSFRFDDNGRIEGFDFDEARPEFTFASQYISDELATRIAHFGQKMANIRVIKFPMRSLTVNGIRAYLDTLEVVDKFIPDMLILDYVGVMKTDDRNHRISLGRVFEDFKGLCDERNVAGIGVQQVSKVGATSENVSHTHVAEDWSLTNTADQILTYTCTNHEFKYGLARLFAAKARSEEDKFGVLLTQNYKIGQFCLDSHLLDPKYYELLDKLKKDDDEDEDDDTEEGDEG
jgi:intein/homing endonuclease